MKLQEALTAMEAKVRNSMSRLPFGTQVYFEKIDKKGSFFTARFNLVIPITDPEELGENNPQKTENVL